MDDFESLGFKPINSAASQSEQPDDFAALGFKPASSTPVYEDIPQAQDTSKTESFLRGAGQGASLGFSDEMLGAYDAILKNNGIDVSKEDLATYLKRAALAPMAVPMAVNAAAKATMESVTGKGPGFGGLVKDYQQERDAERALLKQAQDTNPWSYGSGNVAGGIATAFVPGGALASGFKGAVALGGAAGLGTSDVDLTKPVGLEEGKQLATDVGLGAGLGGGFYGAGKLLGVGAKAARDSELGQSIANSFKVGKSGTRLGGIEGSKNYEKSLNKFLDKLSKNVNTKEGELKNAYDILELSSDPTKIPFKSILEKIDNFDHADPEVMKSVLNLRNTVVKAQEKYARPLFSQLHITEETIPAIKSNEQEIIGALTSKAKLEARKLADLGVDAEPIVEKILVDGKPVIRKVLKVREVSSAQPGKPTLFKEIPDAKRIITQEGDIISKKGLEPIYEQDSIPENIITDKLAYPEYKYITPEVPAQVQYNTAPGPTTYGESIPYGKGVQLQKDIGGLNVDPAAAKLKGQVNQTIKGVLGEPLGNVDAEYRALKQIKELFNIPDSSLNLNTAEGIQAAQNFTSALEKMAGSGPKSRYMDAVKDIVRRMGGEFENVADKDMDNILDVIKSRKSITKSGLDKKGILSTLGSSTESQASNLANLVGTLENKLESTPGFKSSLYKLTKKAAGKELEAIGKIPQIGGAAAKTVTANDISKASNIYNFDNNQLSMVVNQLRTSPFNKQAEALQEAIDKGDNYKKNAIIFSLLQNPNSRNLIQGE